MKRQTVKKDADAAVKKGVGNYEKHPFFVKKNNEAKEFLKTVGLPENYKVTTGKTN